jgi:hypothetical protein
LTEAAHQLFLRSYQWRDIRERITRLAASVSAIGQERSVRSDARRSVVVG